MIIEKRTKASVQTFLSKETLIKFAEKIWEFQLDTEKK